MQAPINVDSFGNVQIAPETLRLGTYFQFAFWLEDNDLVLRIQVDCSEKLAFDSLLFYTHF